MVEKKTTVWIMSKPAFTLHHLRSILSPFNTYPIHNEAVGEDDSKQTARKSS